MKHPHIIELGHGGLATRLHGGRLQLQQGPINLVIKAYGDDEVVEAAYREAICCFPTILQGLVNNLSILKQPVGQETASINTCNSMIHNSPTADHMMRTTSAYADIFVTPMASVAGAVADQILDAMKHVEGIQRLYVNNGGDIALYLADQQKMDIGVVPSLARAVPESKIVIDSSDNIGGVATSGWNGPSFSMGIADAVTVLAKDAASADVAATLVANSVNIEADAIIREPASAVDDTSDLGNRLVTTGVGDLTNSQIRMALKNGINHARHLINQKLIRAVLISLQGQWVSAGEKFHLHLAGYPKNV